MDKGILLLNQMEKDPSSARKTGPVVTYQSVSAQRSEKEGPKSWVSAPLQVKPH